ncbi:MAG: hypothetical protein JOY87_10030 [Candidatus Eremiobacteraeota bacterium]|nr:hypothetical protein [Candidatus Eremiobacteraeota bacterium]
MEYVWLVFTAAAAAGVYRLIGQQFVQFRPSARRYYAAAVAAGGVALLIILDIDKVLRVLPLRYQRIGAYGVMATILISLGASLAFFVVDAIASRNPRRIAIYGLMGFIILVILGGGAVVALQHH